MTKQSTNKGAAAAHATSFPLRGPLSALALAALVACGGGGGGVPAAGPAAETPSNVLSGAVVKGPVASSTVCAFELLPSGKGKGLGCTLSNEDGSYSLSLAYTGPVVVEATGGYYTDEASGKTGVDLGAPLSVAGTVGAGTNTLVATPLTALAFAQASRGGNLSVAAFDAAAAEVGTAFGLPGSVNLATTVPSVTGTKNAYGDALITVSQMLGHGATLAGIIANTDFAGLKQGAQTVGATTCGGGSEGRAMPAAVAELQPGGVFIDEAGLAPGAGTMIIVTQPHPSWLALLPQPGPAMGCTLVSASAESAQLKCAPDAYHRAMYIAEGAEVDMPTSLPPAGFIYAAGRRIDVLGRQPADLFVFADQIHMPAPPAAAPGGNGTITNPGGITISVPTVPPSANISDLPGKLATIGNLGPITNTGKVCVSQGLAPSGSPSTAGVGLTGTGSGVTTPAGTISNSGGSIVISGSGGGIAVTGTTP
ncbi:MAG: hypothetical protein ABW051_02830 [Burkholderiaceae bacterium]